MNDKRGKEMDHLTEKEKLQVFIDELQKERDDLIREMNKTERMQKARLDRVNQIEESVMEMFRALRV